MYLFLFSFVPFRYKIKDFLLNKDISILSVFVIDEFL